MTIAAAISGLTPTIFITCERGTAGAGRAYQIVGSGFIIAANTEFALAMTAKHVLGGEPCIPCCRPPNTIPIEDD